MKKVSSILLAVLFMFSLAACGGSGQKYSEDEEDATAVEETMDEGVDEMTEVESDSVEMENEEMEGAEDDGEEEDSDEESDDE